MVDRNQVSPSVPISHPEGLSPPVCFIHPVSRSAASLCTSRGRGRSPRLHPAADGEPDSHGVVGGHVEQGGHVTGLVEP